MEEMEGMEGPSWWLNRWGSVMSRCDGTYRRLEHWEQDDWFWLVTVSGSRLPGRSLAWVPPGAARCPRGA